MYAHAIHHRFLLSAVVSGSESTAGITMHSSVSVATCAEQVVSYRVRDPKRVEIAGRTAPFDLRLGG